MKKAEKSTRKFVKQLQKEVGLREQFENLIASKFQNVCQGWRSANPHRKATLPDGIILDISEEAARIFTNEWIATYPPKPEKKKKSKKSK